MDRQRWRIRTEVLTEIELGFEEGPLDRDMRIVHVVDTMEIGGAEVVTATLCRLQRNHGHDPSVVCLFRKGKLAEQLSSERFTVDCMGSTSTPVLTWRLLRYFRRVRPDVVHCHNAMATITAAYPARVAGARVLSTRHGLVAPPHRLRREIKFSLAALACDSLIGVCDATADNLRRLPLAKHLQIERVYNGVCSEQQEIARQVRDDVTVVSVGRLIPLKDFETLLRAFAAAYRRVRSLRLVIIGEGPQAPALKALSAELKIDHRVQFVGETTNVRPYLETARMFAMSSQSEGLPMSLLEAMDAGLPAIVSDVGGMAEAVKLADAGLIVPVSDFASFADAIIRVAEHDSLWRTLHRAALVGYRTHFTAERMAAQYLSIYRCRMRKMDSPNFDSSPGVTPTTTQVTDSVAASKSVEEPAKDPLRSAPVAEANSADTADGGKNLWPPNIAEKAR